MYIYTHTYMRQLGGSDWILGNIKELLFSKCKTNMIMHFKSPYLLEASFRDERICLSRVYFKIT